jgi:hypothetical protein
VAISSAALRVLSRLFWIALFFVVPPNFSGGALIGIVASGAGCGDG